MTWRLLLVALLLVVSFVAMECVRPVLRKLRVVDFRWRCWQMERAVQRAMMARLDRELAALRSV